MQKKLLTALLITASLSANAQVKLYTDPLGLPAGSSQSIGNTTIYKDSLGLPLGSAVRSGDTTIYSNSLGLPAGSSKTIGPSPFDSFFEPSSTRDLDADFISRAYSQ
jgi:hypothetical protein